MAIVSLCLSAAGILLFTPFSIVGVILGHKSRWKIKSNSGFKGDELAIIGLSIGYIDLTFLLLHLIGLGAYIAFLAAIFTTAWLY